MPLQINLYHEVQSQKAASRRDPLKIAAYILGFVVLVFAGIYLWEFNQGAALNAEFTRRKVEFDALDPKAREAEKREKELQKTFALSEGFVKAIEGRFYWAPLLEELAKLVPNNVQITKLEATQQGEAPKRFQYVFEGVAAGTDPRRTAEDLRQSIVEEFGKKFKNVTANFRQLDDGTAIVKLEGKNLATANFVIAVGMQLGDDAPPPPPPPSERKKRRG